MPTSPFLHRGFDVVREGARISDLMQRNNPPVVVVPPVAPTPAPEVLTPQLFLAEEYRVSVIRGDIHRDELIAPGPQLTPGSTQKLVVATRIKTSEERSQQSCILDSQSAESTKSFNEKMEQASDERYGSERYDYGMHGHFHGEGSVGFGSAEGDASVDVAGSTNDVRQEFGSSFGKALDQQVSSANSARHEQAQTASSGTTFSAEQFSSTEVEVHNTTGKTQNYGVFQVKEETISILSLTDVKLMFGNGHPADTRTASMYQARDLLTKVLADSEMVDRVLRRVRETLSNVRDYRDEVRSIIRDDPGPTGFTVNRSLTQRYEIKDSTGQVRRTVEAPGVILSVASHYVRKPGVTVLLPLTAA